MRAGRLYAGAGDPGVYIRLSDAGQAFVGMNFHDNIILRRTGRADIIGGVQQDMAGDVSNFHDLNLSVLMNIKIKEAILAKLSRRELLYSASALSVTRLVRGAKPRPTRKDCFFGLHFDLHPTPEDTALGRDVTEETIFRLLRACRPDFVQYDSKGHPGYLGFPSKTGMSAPNIVQDSLAIWRRVTARESVALYNHFSGVLDGLAVKKHPDWARTGPDGKRDEQETSLFSSYEEQLMIPELEEVALKYDLDGSWVDGDCWAVKPDYGEASVRQFREKTGIEQAPKGPQDRGWNEFLELQREKFRQYVAKYVEALHRDKPGFQITSNWMYSTFAPERPTLPLDYLSGDIADQAPVRRARVEARYFSQCGKPWDLMSWGFETDPKFGHMSDKPVVALEQEAAIVLAQGGAYQIYYTPSRAGWIDERIVKAAAAVGAFCRERQEWSHRSESIPEVGVLFSGRTLYRTANRVFGSWGAALAPVEGAVDLLLACGYSVDLLPDWLAPEHTSQYPLIVVPDWKDLGEDMVGILTTYVDKGGKLLLCGAENTQLFSTVFNLRVSSPAKEHHYFVADENGFADVRGQWIEIEAQPADIILNAYRTLDTRKDTLPLGLRIRHGKGSVVVCPGPITSAYGMARTPIIRSAARRLAVSLREPLVRVEGDFPALEIVLRKKNGQMFIHLISSAGAPVTGEFRHTGVVPRTGPLKLRVRLPTKPLKVMLQPEGTALAGEYEAGEWRGLLPDLHIHSGIQCELRS